MMNRMETYDRARQFRLEPIEFLKKLDFLNWYRFYFIVKEVGNHGSRHVLEVGPGEGAIKRVLEPFVERYETMDVNAKLTPDHHTDVRDRRTNLEHRFDCVIAADILEHIPFADLGRALENLQRYLRQGGIALITIPHRAWFIFVMNWLTYKHHVVRAPDWMRKTYSRLHGRKNWIDSDHQGAIGDGYHASQDVERVMEQAGFKIDEHRKLLYVDFWVLLKT